MRKIGIKEQVNKGDRFGRWTVIEEVEGIRYSPNTRIRRFLCVCDCGTERVVRYDYLKNGKSKSCGCLLSEINKSRRTYEEGIVNSRLYHIWWSMKQRCYYPKHINYNIYGGKGVTMCQEWLDDFMTFYNWALANGYSEELTIDRIDSNGNYEPSNCRWATYKEQANNTCKATKITYKGITHTINEWADIVGIKAANLRHRIIIRRWPVEKAFFTPVQKRK